MASPFPLWEGADNSEGDNCLNDAQLALTASGPIIAAQAKAEALREFADEIRDFPGEPTLRNHIADLARARAASIKEGAGE